MLVSKRRLSALTVYLIYSGASSLFLSIIFTVNLVYQVEVAHLNPLQLVLVGTVLEIVCFLCQIPTGVIADVYSRRLAVIIGIFAIGAGFILEGSIPRFAFILAAQALWGFGATLTDGAEQAWIAGEVGEDKVGSVFSRSTQVGLIGGLLGAVISVGLASVWLNLPIIVGGGSMVMLGVFLLRFMPESGFQSNPKEERQSWQAMGNMLRSGLRLVRRQSVLLTILFVELFYGLASEGYDRLSTAHFLADFTFPSPGQLKPVVWFGIFAVAMTLLSLAATEIVRRRVDNNNERLVVRILLMVNALNIGCVLVFALTGNFLLAVAAYLAYGVFQTASRPIWMTWLTRNIDAKVRATVISLDGQMNALGQIAGGPPVGYIGTVFSLRAALVAVSIILSPVLLLFVYAARRVRGNVVKIPVEEEGENPAPVP
jgi:DHA3 family tetracycline resistance protein-like MFS transporter